MGTPTLRKQQRHVIAALSNSLSQSKDPAWYRRLCVIAPTVERLPRVCLLLTLLSRIGKSFPRPNRGKITAQLTYHSHLRHLRGQENLSVYSQVATIASGHSMANHFCKTCGTLMYRVGGGFPVILERYLHARAQYSFIFDSMRCTSFVVRLRLEA